LDQFCRSMHRTVTDISMQITGKHVVRLYVVLRDDHRGEVGHKFVVESQLSCFLYIFISGAFPGRNGPLELNFIGTLISQELLDSEKGPQPLDKLLPGGFQEGTDLSVFRGHSNNMRHLRGKGGG
jgi:hypothetical protein